MNRKWPHQCTLYNKYLTTDNVEHWQRTILSGVYVERTAGINYRKQNVQGADKVLTVIPHTAGGDAYVKPLAFAALADKVGHWTLQEGDSLVVGAVDYEVIQSDGELQKLYDEVYTITTVDHFDTWPMAHWEVGGK